MEWISVKDKLPEFGKPVLIWAYPKHPVMEGRIILLCKRRNDIKRYVDENGFPFVSSVTHWLPFPEPPKELGS